MNDLKNLLIWFSYDESGNIVSIAKMAAFDPESDLDAAFDSWMNNPLGTGGIELYVKEHITVPDHLMGVDGVAFVLYVNGKRFRAALPYFVTIEE